MNRTHSASQPYTSRWGVMVKPIAQVLTVISLVVLLMPGVSSAQSKVGTTAAPFLTIGVGSRPQAMGGAFTAIADDAHALYWNPAGLARLQQSQVVMVHSTWLADMSFDYVGMAFALGQLGTFGLSATLLSVGEMEVTTNRFQDGTGLMFNSYSMATAVSYGYRFYDRFSIGGSAKFIQEKIWNESANGIALDVGTLLITPLKDIRLGMSISNFGTKMRMEGRDLTVFHDPDPNREGNNPNIPAEIKTDAWKLPLTMRLGFAGEVLQTLEHRLTAALDWVVPNDNTEFVNLGFEYGFNEYVFLRSGYRAMRPGMYSGDFRLSEEDNGGGMTFGGGVKLGVTGGFKFVADYAYEGFERLGSVHKYSLSVQF